MELSLTRSVAAASLTLILLVAFSGCQNTSPNKPNHGQGEAIQGSGMPDYQDGSS